MVNSLLLIFDEIWLKTLYYSTGSLTQFWSKFKIFKKSKFDCNELKVSTQHKYMYMHQKNYKNGKFSPIDFDEIWQKTLYYSTGSLTRFWSNFKIFLKIQI